MNLLLKEGADVNSEGYDGTTALMFAVSNNGVGDNSVPSSTRIECVSILLENGADVNKIDSKGFTALFLEALNGYEEIVQLIKLKGAALNTMDSEKYCRNIHNLIKRNLPDCLTVLVGSGIKVNVRDDKGVTPLLIAAQQGHDQCLDNLVKNQELM